MVKKIDVYQIDKDIPVPNRDDRITIPLEKLEVGESFLFPLEKRDSVQAKASKLKKATDKEFTIEKQDNESCRVWRIA